MTDTEPGENMQAFECEVCDQRYQLECEYPIDRITIECSQCGEYSAWCHPA